MDSYIGQVRTTPLLSLVISVESWDLCWLLVHGHWLSMSWRPEFISSAGMYTASLAPEHTASRIDLAEGRDAWDRVGMAEAANGARKILGSPYSPINESVEDSKNRESLSVCQELTLPSSAKLDGPDPEHERRVCSIEAGRREAQMFQLWIARSIRTQGTPGSSGDEDEAQKSQTGVTLPRAKLAWRASQRGDRKPQMGVVRRKKGEKEVRNKIFPLNEKVIQ
ncbi:hypothetical protein DFH09DRAFT_1076728 [Mycena vulgaris]|nr:hypothetical protein DFH09DRAFT_1076728 [Mycena vulgaris]